MHVWYVADSVRMVARLSSSAPMANSSTPSPPKSTRYKAKDVKYKKGIMIEGGKGNLKTGTKRPSVTDHTQT